MTRFAGSLPLKGGDAPSPPRRVVALCFPDLACELAILERESRVGVAGALDLDQPLAVVLCDEGERPGPGSLVHGATATARRAGVKSGQTVEQAQTTLAGLEVRALPRSRLDAALRGFSEVAWMASHRQRPVPPDALLLDVSHEVRTPDDEENLVFHLCERVRLLGHRVRAAASSSDAAALLLARSGPRPWCVVVRGLEREALAGLSLGELPLPPHRLDDLLDQGHTTLGQVPALLDELLDRTPIPCEPLPLSVPLTEGFCWSPPVEAPEPLLFVLHGLAARASARLAGRGQEAHFARLLLLTEGAAALAVEPSAPRLYARTSDLVTALRPRLEATPLPGPVRELRLELGGLRAAGERADASVSLARLASELGTELGPGRVGVLSTNESASLPRLTTPPSLQLALWPPEALTPPTRVLDVPAPINGKLARGARVEIDHVTFVVQRVTPVEPSPPQPPPNHENLLVWLSHGDSSALAWVLRERRQKRAFLHGWFT